MKTVVIGLFNSIEIARRIARRLGVPFSAAVTKYFPDGELYLRFTTPVKGAKVILVQSFYPHPSKAMLELIFAAYAAKEQGAKRVVGAIPYLGYMRQDKAFHRGEGISAHYMAKLLSKALDELVTIDPHLHRIHHMREVFTNRARAITANIVLAEYIGKHFKNEIIIGPDMESYQWAQRIAAKLHLHALVLKKKRYTARKVRIKIKTKVPIRGKNVVIVDDIISSGHTMIETVKEAKRLKARTITCIAVHGVLAEGALQKIRRAGARVITSNTITNPTAKIDVSPLLADALKK